MDYKYKLGERVVFISLGQIAIVKRRGINRKGKIKYIIKFKRGGLNMEYLVKEFNLISLEHICKMKIRN